MTSGDNIANLADARKKFAEEIDLNFVLAIAAAIDEKQIEKTAWQCRRQIERAFGDVTVMSANFAKKRNVSIADSFCKTSGEYKEFQSFTHSSADVAMIALYVHLVQLCDLDPFNPNGPNDQITHNSNGDEIVYIRQEDARDLHISGGAGFYTRNAPKSNRQLTKC